MKFILLFFITLLIFVRSAFYPCQANLCKDCVNSDNLCRTCLSNYSTIASLKATIDGFCPCPVGFYYVPEINLCKHCNINCL